MFCTMQFHPVVSDVNQVCQFILVGGWIAWPFHRWLSLGKATWNSHGKKSGSINQKMRSLLPLCWSTDAQSGPVSNAMRGRLNPKNYCIVRKCLFPVTIYPCVGPQMCKVVLCVRLWNEGLDRRKCYVGTVRLFPVTFILNIVIYRQSEESLSSWDQHTCSAISTWTEKKMEKSW